MRNRTNSSPAESPAARITAEILARLEAGTKPWIKPWRGVAVSRPLRACGTAYRGMNVFWLWMVADMCGFGPGHGTSFRWPLVPSKPICGSTLACRKTVL